MKKLLALVLLFSFVFTSCSYRQEDKEVQTLPVIPTTAIVPTLVETEPVLRKETKPSIVKTEPPKTKVPETKVATPSTVTESTTVTKPKATTAKTKKTKVPETTKPPETTQKPLELKDLPRVGETSHGKMKVLEEKKINNLRISTSNGFELISVTVEYALIDERYNKQAKKLKVWDFGSGVNRISFKMKTNVPGKYFYHATVRHIETGELYNTNTGWFDIADRNYKDLDKDGNSNNPTFKKEINKTFEYKFEG